MKEYHKIQTVFFRDMEHNSKRLKLGVWSKPEFEYLKDAQWVCEEKIDGTNIRILYNGSDIEIRGKTDNAQLHPELVKNIKGIFSNLVLFNDIFPMKDNQPLNVCLYGEGFGPGIQKAGGNYTKKGIITSKSFILFDVKVGDLFLEREAVLSIAKHLSCLFTPVVFAGTLLECIEFAKNGFQSQFGDFIAEGIIARPLVELKSRRGERIITKLKYEDFRHDLYADDHSDMIDATLYSFNSGLGPLPPVE